MPQYSDDLFLGAAPTGMGSNPNVPLGNPAEMGLGVGPLGRVFIWDVVPQALNATCIAPAFQYTGAITLVAGTSVTAVTRADGQAVLQLDCPRALGIAVGAGVPVNRFVTIVGYDIYGQKLSEDIFTGTTQSVTARGEKAFHQILSATISGDPGVLISVGTLDKLGSPVAIQNTSYVMSVTYNRLCVTDFTNFIEADDSTPTSQTFDVRGVYTLQTAANGQRRLVVALAMPADAVGPAATRAGALGVNQNLAS